MDTDASPTEVANGEVSGCIKAGPSKQPDDDAESKADNVDSTAESPKAGSITNGCPDGDSTADDVTASKSVNGTSELNAGDDVSCLDKPSSEADALSVVEDSSKGNSEVAECGGDSQQDSIADEDGEKAEPMETGEDVSQPPEGQGSEPVKNKETNSEESTPSSTPGRKSKKKSKKVSKLSIMHAIAKRLSGQAKGGEAQSTAKAETKADAESNANDSTSEAKEEKPPQETKGPVDADPKPASPAREPSSSKKSGNTCAVCSAVKGLRYQVLYQGKTQFLCSDGCFKAFRSMQKLAPKKPAVERDQCAQCQKEHAAGAGYYSSFGACKPLCTADCLRKHEKAHSPKRQCAQCQALVDVEEQNSSFLVWETMEFCAEDCLRKYQSANGSRCSHCNTAVNQLSLGKYCVRFGADIRQFCSGKCLEEFKRGLKVCCLCQKDLSKQKEGFLAPVGEAGQFKDFCSQQCLERYERMNAFNAANLVPHKCTACGMESTTKYQVEYNDGSQRLCSDVCVSKFRYANKIKQIVCENCHSLFDSESNKPISLYHENVCQQFCNKACVNLFVLSHRKIVPCAWCKVKKYNFDMIERVESTGSHLFCSLNCLNLFRVNQNASSARVIRCDYCHTMQPAQYHLTMSDASIRNFCCYKCVLAFQNQFKNLPVLTTSSPTVSPATMARAQVAPGASTAAGGTPVISNIRSLAPATKPGGQPVIPTSMQSASEMNSAMTPAPRPPPPALTAMPKVVSVPVQVQANVVQDKILAPSPHIVAAMAKSSSMSSSQSAGAVKEVTPMAPGHTEREVIIQLPFPKLLRNKALLCRPQVAHKAILCKPEPGSSSDTQSDAEVQADLGGPARLIPVPVPIYVPVPMHMFAHAVPSPLPIPIPVPVPIFLPTTRDTTEQIREMLKEATEQMQNNDKFDEVLLAIARSLAESASSRPPSSENKAGSTKPKSAKRAASDDETDVELPTKKLRTASDGEMEPVETEPVEIEPVETAPKKTLSAKMEAIDTEPVETDPVEMDPVEADPVGTDPVETDPVEKDPVETDPVETDPVETDPVETDPVETDPVETDPVEMEPAEMESAEIEPVKVKPSACSTATEDGEKNGKKTHELLDPAAAVSAWQDWVHKKNAELEKGSLSGKRQLKLFKTNLLSMTPEELNYALSLFIKEVQLAGGGAPSPCRFYLQCLGIQQYLYEQGRQDNIFADPQYEMFTGCFHSIFSQASDDASAESLEHIQEEVLWQSRQLGSHSPLVLLNTLLYFNVKYFGLHTVDQHLNLTLADVSQQEGAADGPEGKPIKILRATTKQSTGEESRDKGCDQLENLENPERCPVKLYELYLSKCPDSVRSQQGAYYMLPDRASTAESAVWYTSNPLGKDAISRMLTRFSIVEEVKKLSSKQACSPATTATTQ